MQNLMQKLKGMSALQIAVKSGDVAEASKVIQKFPGTIDAVTPKDGRTALHMAAESGFEAIVGQLLDRQPGVRICDSDGRLALHLAVIAGHAGVVAMLMGPRNREQAADKLSMLKSVDKGGQDAVMMAVQAGHAGVLQILLAAGANPNAVHQGFPAVYAAAAAGFTHLLPILAAAGANMDARVSGTGASALHIAAVTGQAAVVSMLLRLQANTSAKDNNGKTPLEAARLAMQPQTISLLREHSTQAPQRSSSEPPTSIYQQQQQQNSSTQQQQPYQHQLFPDKQASLQNPPSLPQLPSNHAGWGANQAIVIPSAVPQSVNYPSLPPGATVYY